MKRIIPFLLLAFAFAACQDEGPTVPTDGALFGKGGKKPKPSGDPPITVAFADRDGDNIRSDDLGPYEDGTCDVDATFNLNDARLYLSGRVRRKDREACGDGRDIIIAFTDRVAASPPGGQDGNVVDGGFMIVDGVELVTEVGETVQRLAVFHMPGCAQGLRFEPAAAEEPFTANWVDVTKISDDTWTVEAQPDDVAVCVPSTSPPGKVKSYYHMPFAVTVTLK